MSNSETTPHQFQLISCMSRFSYKSLPSLSSTGNNRNHWTEHFWYYVDWLIEVFVRSHSEISFPCHYSVTVHYLTFKTYYNTPSWPPHLLLPLHSFLRWETESGPWRVKGRVKWERKREGKTLAFSPLISALCDKIQSQAGAVCNLPSPIHTKGLTPEVTIK